MLKYITDYDFGLLLVIAFNYNNNTTNLKVDWLVAYKYLYQLNLMSHSAKNIKKFRTLRDVMRLCLFYSVDFLLLDIGILIIIMIT